MNVNNPFQTIKDFCRGEKLNITIERILYHKYQQEINELIQSYKDENNGNKPSDDTIQGFKQTLLSENTLSTNVRLADEEIEDILKDKITAEKRKIGRINFWKSVLSSVVGSFFFVLLLILIFIVAENQVRGLLGTDLNQREEIKNESQSNK